MGEQSIAIGTNSTAIGAERRITHVADGVNTHDAANMGQLHHVEDKLADNINKVGAGAEKT